MPTQRVCLISPDEEEEFLYFLLRDRTQWPNCRTHTHCSHREAWAWANDKHGHYRPEISEVIPQGAPGAPLEQRVIWKQRYAAHFVDGSSYKLLVIERLVCPELRGTTMQWTGTPVLGGPRTYSSNGWPDVLITESMRKQ